MNCPVCAATFSDLRQLAHHLVDLAERSDGDHVMWLNRSVTKERCAPSELEPLLAAALAGESPRARG